uniref:Uncharacterized protein n=1 Tax=Podoviridae sp. ct1h53 TaxID=2826536 RepID=A0A8S5MGX6_9CAUD|nr:MAG TPA: hypothetical protein [Podoviridae sp. ct1h53]
MPDRSRRPNAGNLVVRIMKRTKRRAKAGGKAKIVLIPRTVLGINQ